MTGLFLVAAAAHVAALVHQRADTLMTLQDKIEGEKHAAQTIEQIKEVLA